MSKLPQHSLAKMRKSLLIFDLDGVLCHMTKEFKKVKNVQGVFATKDDQAVPIMTDKNIALFGRP